MYNIVMEVTDRDYHVSNSAQVDYELELAAETELQFTEPTDNFIFKPSNTGMYISRKLDKLVSLGS